MKETHRPNANPMVEKIVQAYLSTQMNERQFEALVEEMLVAAKNDAGAGSTADAYDKGFSDGYDTAMGEK